MSKSKLDRTDSPGYATTTKKNFFGSVIGRDPVDQWRGSILTSADAAGLTNADELSMFVMMTCLNGYFQDVALDSLAESLLKANGLRCGDRLE